MLTLKYTGPKPMISEHGISFKDGKEDKYVYLTLAIQILKAIDHDTMHQSNYEYYTNGQKLDDEQMQSFILSYHPKLETTLREKINTYMIHLETEIENIKKNLILNTIEKEAYIANLNIMKEYKIQRAKNKIFYMHAIDTIVEVIKQRKLKKISTPFDGKFWHILQTIQGHLTASKQGLKSELKVITNDETMYAILTIDNNF